MTALGYPSRPLDPTARTVIDSFVNNIINPIIRAIVGKPEFTNALKLGKGETQYGAFINTVINLAITGLVLFLIVKVYGSYRARKIEAGEEPEEPTEEVVLLRRIATVLETRSA